MSNPITVATVVVFDYEVRPDGTPIANAQIELTLEWNKSTYTSGGGAIASVEQQKVVATTDGNGYWQASVVANAALGNNPPGTTTTSYLVKTPGRRYRITIPSGAGPFQASQIVAT